MSKKLLFNFNREVIQNYTYVKYVGTIITATNTLEKPIKSAILKGSTKYRDIDTGEFLETFEEGRNLELVSVKMPVLTTTGKNLFPNIKFIHHRGLHQLSGNIANVTTDDWACEDYLNVPQQKTLYTNMLYIGLSWTKICFYDENKNYRSHIMNNDTIIFPENAKYWRVGAFVTPENSQLLNQIMLCNSLKEARSAYEPFKSNILTVNEDVTLRSNGDICDELNLLTGQLTQRIGEDGVVLSQEVVKTVVLSILDQSGNKVSSISSFNDTTHITASSETIPPIFEGYLATKEG